MKVVLNSDVPKLGYKGDIVNVKDGYFRNYLLPRRLADMATVSRVKVAKSRDEKRVFKKQQLVDSAKEVIGKLKGLKVKIVAKVTDKGTLYGAITENDVIEAIKAASNVLLEKDFLKMEHIKEVGDHKVTVSLGDGLEEMVKVKVEAEKPKKVAVVAKTKKTTKKAVKAKKA